MFAPPPVNALSRAQIEAKRAELQAKRTSSVGSAELQRTESGGASPKAESSKGRRPFSTNKKDVDEIRVGEAEQWKLFGRKGKSKLRSGSDASSVFSVPPTPTTALSPPPPPTPTTDLLSPPLPPPVPAGSAKRSDGRSMLSVKEEETSAVVPAPGPGMRAEQSGGKARVAPRRPTRPTELSLPGSFPTTSTPTSMRSISPATPPPSKAPPPTPAMSAPSLSPKPVPLPSPTSPPPTQSPPPIPAKSPRRQQAATRPASQPVPSPSQKPYTKTKTISDGAISTVMSGLKIKDPIHIGAGEHPHPPHLARASSAPAPVTHSRERNLTRGPAQRNARPANPSSLRSGTTSTRGKRQSRGSVYFGEPPSSPTRIAKPAVKRRTNVARRSPESVSLRSALQDIGAATFIDLSRSGAKKGARSPRTPASIGRKTSRARGKNGETVSMLQTSGFFSNATGVMFNPQNPNVNVELPSVHIFADRDLPTTPDSIVSTPVEMYQSHRSSLSAERQSSGSTKRSPLAQISAVDAKANSNAPSETMSPTALLRLTTIPEFSSFSENEALASGAATPIATRIHLRGGSVVTVSPPELTAWQRSIYIQGPIKLPKPAILPRKNSVASMEPFQDAIDRVYQNALFIPRRRSDDAIVDDICEFFDDFGFDDVGYDGDLLAIDEMDVDEVDEMDLDEVDVMRKGSEVERFSTPPGFPTTVEATPIEKLIAKDVLETNMATADSPTRPSMPDVTIVPVENEETLRARGIARLSQRSQSSQQRNSQFSARKNSEFSAYRRDSEASLRKASVATSTRTRDSIMFDGNNISPTLKSPEPSILDVVVEGNSGFSDDDGDAGGMDWSDDEVQETDSNAAWTAPASARKKHALNRGLVGRDRMNPVSRMRRLVATATTIL